MISQILNSNIKWDGVIAGIFLVCYFGYLIFNLLKNNAKSSKNKN